MWTTVKVISFLIFPILPGSGENVTSEVIENRILEGVDVNVEDFPWQVQIVAVRPTARWVDCGGAIISPSIVLTAAHCLVGVDIKKLKVRAGSSTTKTRGDEKDIQSFKMHPSFDSNDFNYDIAIIWLTSSFVFSPRVKSIPMANKNLRIKDRSAMAFCGWGNIAEGVLPSHLKGLVFYKLNLKICKTRITAVSNLILNDRVICADNPRLGTICSGDSGSPLTMKGVLVGISAFGAKRCINHGVPSVFTSIAAMRQWIRKASGI